MTVYLVGAGPGDPGLLTVRGAELLARADAVVFDRLSARELLGLAPETAELHDVGKGPDGPSTPQSLINELLVDLARRFGPHGVVVRLKGGDPFVFARGAEELEALLEAGLPAEVVPGVSSAIAAPAYAGIPVTRRYSSTSFTVVTGHEDPTKESTEVDWEAIARVGGTIVILMGVARLGAIAERLIAGGLDPATPAVAVRWGSRPDQSTVRATLATLASQQLRSPSVIVVGEVAASDLDWFAQRPLVGREVVVTRSPKQSSRLVAMLQARGATVVEVPTVEQVDPVDGGEGLRSALQGLVDGSARPRWLVVSSPTSAARFVAGLGTGVLPAPTGVVAMGPGTAEALSRRGVRADLLPGRYVAEGVLDAIGAAPAGDDVWARTVWILRAEVGRNVLLDGLRAAGWNVRLVATHRTVAVPIPPERLDDVQRASIVAFASSSAVTSFIATVPEGRFPAVAVVIGPITAGTARDAGFATVVEATEHTVAGLVASIERWAIDDARR